MLRALAALVLGLTLFAGSAAPGLAQSIRVTVNGAPITDMAVAARVKLFQLERREGGSKAATDELINEAIMLQEAKRVGIEVSESQVSNAVLSVARNLKLSRDKLIQLLGANGVSLDTLQDRLRASLAWQGVTQNVVSPRVQISELELEQKAAGKVTEALSYDYVLKEVIFLTGGRGSASARTGQANQYRKNFQGCDTAVQLSTSYTDAAVVDVGRRHATQMPEALANELAGLNVGGITKPRVVEKGVSMLAICSKAHARDLTFLTNQLRQEAGNEAMKGEVDKYLADLKAKARIVYN